ncbi:hypothetical protein DespoDRAFT_01346 [Desulfobacter postgatei 2ac9]|jgi:short-subunit dehydrogenase|uniref:Uncharacterized protein n=1 Tax=Desulfobacter postgatei 2ac9 TaxID=879212 RepID=I5B1D4_9BACT|nr:hypothetical protein DespoDRAFT_01346 [Desulfobacter postgatei 2ac9]
MLQAGVLKNFFHSVEKQGVRGDILVNNTRIGWFTPFSQMLKADSDRHFSLNVQARLRR